MNSNVNRETGIRFGYISSLKLHPDVVEELLFDYGADLSYEEFISNGGDEEEYTNEEPTIEGFMEGVHYSSSWLGGALHFFILKSPIIVKRELCSPCVPNAGDFGTEGEYECYGVPEDWYDGD